MAGIENTVGSMQPEDFLKQRRRSIFIDYLITTSVAGLGGIGRAYSTYNRLFWVAIFTVAFGFMFYFILSTVLQYFTYPTQTNVGILSDFTMPFPAVTICSANPIRYDKINASLVDFFYRLNAPNVPFNQDTLNSLSLPLLIDLFNRNQTEERLSIGFQLSDMLLMCSYNGIDCSNTFTVSVLSAIGNCFTFNWKTSTKFFTLNNFGDTLVLREGLQMTFYIPQELYFPFSMYGIGLIVLLHDNNELPLPNENGLSLQPGAFHLINYRKSITTFLPGPYTRCTSIVSKDLEALYQATFINRTASTVATYSESVCYELCEQAYIFSRCSCILPVPFMTRYVLTLDGNLAFTNCCDTFTDQIACAYTAKQQFTASEQLQTTWCSHCTPQCLYTNFYSTLSAQLAPSDGEKAYWASILRNAGNMTSVLFPNDFAQNFDYYFNRNYLSLSVTCGSKYITKYTQQATLSLGSMFSDIGGQTGLWLGMSVVTIFELGELAYRLIHKNIIRRRDEPIIHAAPVTITMNRS